MNTNFNTLGFISTSFGSAGSGLRALALTGTRLAGVGFFNGPASASGTASRVIAVERATSNGLVDNSYGSDGVILTDAGGTTSEAFAASFQPDLKLVVAGRATISGNFDMAIVRYNP